MLFYDLYTYVRVSDFEILADREPLFFLGVYDEVITEERWTIIGMLPIKDEHKAVPNKFIQDPLNPSRYPKYDYAVRMSATSNPYEDRIREI